jgi:hypothetical protein
MSKDKTIDPNALPQNEVFNKKEVNQHPQPADTGDALKAEQQKPDPELKGKLAERTSREEGINEQQSDGSASAFGEFIDNAEKD